MIDPIRKDAKPQLPAAWRRTAREHDAAVAAFIDVVNAIPESAWSRPSMPGKWSPAEEVLHVALSYDVALRGARSGEGMRPRVSPLRARLLRWLVLPLILETGWFPRAKAPVEVRPPKADDEGAVDLTRAALLERVAERARSVREELPACRPALRFRHAYFGDLAPRQAMRMLAAHTRHHTRVLARRFRNVME